MSLLITAILAALKLLAGRLITSAFFEAVLIDVILWCGDNLAKLTSNDLDDNLMKNIRAALLKVPVQAQAPEPQPEPEQMQSDAPIDYELAIRIAADRRDYAEAARLTNEMTGNKP